MFVLLLSSLLLHLTTSWTPQLSRMDVFVFRSLSVRPMIFLKIFISTVWVLCFVFLVSTRGSMTYDEVGRPLLCRSSLCFLSVGFLLRYISAVLYVGIFWLLVAVLPFIPVLLWHLQLQARIGLVVFVLSVDSFMYSFSCMWHYVYLYLYIYYLYRFCEMSKHWVWKKKNQRKYINSE